MKDGTLSEASTEAVTGKQLYKVDSKLTETTKKVSDVSKTVEGLSTSVSGLSTNVKKVEGDVSAIAKNASDYLGGGANVLDGTAPTYKVQGKNYQNVGTAFAGVDGSITDIYSKIASVAGDSLVQQEEGANDSGRIIIGSKVGGTEVNFENKDKKGRTLSGLKDGTLSEASTEAVTGKQLYKVDSELTKTTKKVSDVSKTVEGLSTSVSGLSTNVKKVEGDVSAIAKNASDYLGGGANVLDGTAPTYKVQGKNYQNVGTAFAGVDVSITDIYSKIASVGGGSLVEQEASEKGDGLITIGSKVGGTEISLANKDKKGRTLSGLKDGTLSEASTEAVTGKQLYKVDSKLTETTKKVSDVSKTVEGLSTSVSGLSTNVKKVEGDVSAIAKNASDYLGGGANVLDGTAPTYKVQGKNYQNVGTAFAGVDGSITDIYSKIASVAGDSLVQQEASEKGDGLITIGSKVGGTEISLMNKDDGSRTLSGLKDGTLSDASTEAVTGKQLYKVDSKLTETTKKVSDVSKTVEGLSTSVSGLSTNVKKVEGDVSAIAKNASEYLGGGADVLSGTAPTYNVQGSAYTNVSSAFAGVDGSITDLYSQIASVAGGSLVEQEASEKGDGLITIGSKVGGTEISLANKDKKGRTLSGLKDGTLSEASTEAVTGKQLYKVDSKLTETTKKVSDVSKTVEGLSTSVSGLSTNVKKVEGDVSAIAKNASDYLGGGADVLVGTAPTYKVQGKNYQNVGTAFAGVDGSITDIYSKIASVAGDSLVQQEASEKGDGLITIGSKVGGTEISLANKDDGGRILSGLKDGMVSGGSTQAVTGNQLYITNSQIASYLGGGASYEDGKWTDPTFTINVLQEDGSTEEKEYKNVADALKDVSSSFTTVVENNLIQQEESEKGDGLITIGSKVGGTEISLANKDKKGRTLSGLKDGTLSEASTEAVTGKQLYKVDSKLTETTKKVSDVSKTVEGLSTSVSGLSTNVKKVEGDVSAIAKNASDYLGGGANVLDGTAPTYKVQGKNYQNVGTAFAGVDGSITDIYSKIASVAGDSLVQQEASEKGDGLITIGSKVGGTEISLANKDKKGRTLSGLKDGTLSEASTEAVTGKQLYKVDNKLTATTGKVDSLSIIMRSVQSNVSAISENTSNYLGGGASVLFGTAPTYNVQGSDYNNVGEAFAGVDSSLSDIYQELSGVGSKSLVQQEASEDGSGLITIGSKVGGTEISLMNKDDEGRTLSGLKDGLVSEDSTEAVTGKQLYGVNSKLTETTGKVDGLSTSMKQVEGNVLAIAENASNYLGGGANVLDGTAPTYNVQGKNYQNVGTAFAGVDVSITDIYSKIASVAGDSLVQQEASEKGDGLITIGSKVGGTEISLANKDDGGRILSGLKDGMVSGGSTQAVTGNQLYITNSQIASYLGGGASYEDGKWTDPTFTINVLQEDGSTGEKEYKNVADALKDVSSSFTTVVENNLIQQEESEDGDGRITIGAQVGGTEISLENKDKKGRTLSGLKDGTLSAASTEAVTGKQLYEVDTKLTASVDELSTSMTDVQSNVAAISENTSNYLGGGADVLGGTAPTYNVQGSDYNNVGEAFAGVDSSLSDIYQELSGVGSKSLVQQEASEKGDGLITIGSKVGGTEISLANKDKKGRTLSGLKDGTLSEASTEAVTGKQLYKVDSKLTETTGKVDGLSTSMKQVEGNVSAIAENASNYLGGGANVLDGTAPTYNVQGKNYQNVGTAFAGVDVSITDIYSKIASVAGGSLVEQEASEKGDGLITIGSKVGGTEINLANKDDEGRTLSGLKDGMVSGGSTQAVTGNQLYITNSQIASYLGGGASYEDGKWTDPTFTINVLQEDGSMAEKGYKNVADALKDVSSSFTTVVENNLIQQEESEKGDGLITIGSKVGGTEISLANKDKKGRTLSGLKDGTLSEASTEAVTGKQLYKVDNKLTATTGKVDGLSIIMRSVQSNVSAISENTSNYLGGGASVLFGTAPTYNVQGSDYNNVGEAFAGVDSSLSDIYQELSGVGSKSLVQQEASEDGSGLITIGSKVGGTEISLMNKDDEGRTLSGLKDGTLSAASTEAVTGKQLYEVDTKLTASVDELSTSMTDVQSDVLAIAENASNYLGGGANVLGGTAPTYNVQGSDYNNVGEAFAGVDSSLSDIYQELSGVGSKSLVQQEASEKGDGLITIGSKVGGTEISLENKDKKGRTLSGLKDGMVSGGSTQAVTGNQLYITNSQIASYLGGGASYEDGKWTDPTFTINVLQEDGSMAEKGYKNVADALKDVSSSFTTVVENNLIQQEESEKGDGLITIGSKVGGTEISLANKDKKGRTLSGLKDGTLSEASTEAVTGKQLYKVDNKLTATTGKVDGLSIIMRSVQSNVSAISENTSNYLGGGASVLFGTAPTYNVQGSDYNNVGEAFAGVDSSLSDIYQELSGVGSKSLVQQEASEDGSGLITIGSKVGGTEISLMNKDDEGRTLSGLKDGTLSAASTEAVTGKQLYEVDTKLTASVDELSTSMTDVQSNVSAISENTSNYLGGGADVLGGTAPTYNVQGSDYNNVGEAFAGVDSSLSDIYQELSGVGSKSLVQQEASEKGDGLITIGSKVGGTEISLENKDKKGRTLSGLKDGTLSEASTEAVTGKQLYKVDNKLTATTGKVDGLSIIMRSVQSNVSAISENTSNYLGGGASVLFGTAPTYNVQGSDYNNVGEAFAGVDSSLSDIYQELSGVGSKSLVQQEASEKGDGRITIGAQVGGTEISLMNKDDEGRTLSGLKDGTLSEASTEAVTGKQLYEVDTKLTASVDELSTSMTDVQSNVSAISENTSNYLGGGADVLGGTAPTYNVQGSDYNNVGEAFAGVDSSLSDIYQELSGVGSKSLVQQEESEKGDGLITIGSKVGGTEINLANKDDEGRTLSGLKDGMVSGGSTQAVTGNQLYITNSQIASYLGGGASYEDGKWTDPTFTINVLQEDGSTGEKEYKNVADALKDVSSSFTTVVENNLIQQEESEDGDGRITIGAQVGGTEISLENKDKKGRTLSGLKDGLVSEASTEAVTGKQLYEVDTKLTASVDELSTSMTDVQSDVLAIAENASNYLGGGANVLGGTAPTYNVQGSDYNNVGEAFAGVDSSLSDIYQELSGVGSKSLVQQEASEKGDGLITIGSKVGGTEISLANKDKKGRTLSGLKDGTLSEASTEAVTGKQLYKVDNKLTATTGKVDGLSIIMRSVQSNVSAISENTSNYLGGGASVLFGTAPTYNVQGSDYNNVGEAFAGVDSSLSDIYQELSGVGSKSLVQQEESADGSGRITIGSKVGGTEISLMNKDDEGRTLSGLKDGLVSEASTEAVTGKQLYEVDTKLTASVDELSTSMTDVQSDVLAIAENASNYLGGGADVLGGTAPTYNVQGSDYNNVGEAFAGVDSSLSDIYQELSGVGSKSLVQQEASEKGDGRITIGAQVGGTEISLENKDKKGRTLSGLKDGLVSEASTEAVTGKQLYEVDTKLTASVDELSTSMTDVQSDVLAIAENASNYLGGGANVLGGTAPTYNVQGSDYNNVGEAFAGVDSSLSDIYQELSGVGSKSLVQQEESADGSGRITIGSKVGGTEINLANKDGEERTLSGLKDGLVSDNSTEAVTGKQLYATNSTLASYFGGGAEYGANGWVAPTFEVIQFNFGGKAGEQKYDTYNNVADAFGGVNKSMESLNNRIDSVENQAEQNGLNWNEGKGAYDASRKDEEGNLDSSKITGVKDGDISKGSSDVVTGNQLWETNNKVDGLKNDVDDLKNKVDGFEDAVGQMAEGAVQYDKDEDGKKTNKITLAGGDADKPVVIDNIGDGKVEKGSKEAINGGQLYEKMEIVLDDAKKYTDEKMKDAVSEAKDYTDMKFDSLNYNIEGVKQEARQAAAIGIAAANLRYNETPGKLSIAISSGLWRSQSAFAFGAGYTSEDGNIRSNISVTTAGNHFGVGGGVHFTLN
ncbi:YadA-like family protein [Bartonella sp. C271]|uniref:YadA-like family protein n=1 Tax=Bartonella sp. C271 TaxID=3070220 RepID=UPI003D8175CE